MRPAQRIVSAAMGVRGGRVVPWRPVRVGAPVARAGTGARPATNSEPSRISGGLLL